MQPETIQKLLTINRQFYQTFAADFDATRQRIQPGVARVLEMIPPTARILDLGCGNGELARELDRRGFAGEYVGVDFSEGLVERCQVSGVEVSGAQVSGSRYQFQVADLTSPDWEVGLDGPFDVVMAFAVFHHLPGPFHAEIVRKMRALLRSRHPSTTAVSFPKPKEPASAQDADVSLSIPTIPTNSHAFPFPKPQEPASAQDADVSLSIPTIPTNSHEFPFPKPQEPASAQDADVSLSIPTNSHEFPFLKPKVNPTAQGVDDAPSPSLLFSSSPLLPPLFILSNWQFLNSPRWQARIQSWERVGLSAGDVAPNDYLLDWRRGGEGLRYVHHFSEGELITLAKGAGFEVMETFASDGAEGNLGLYQIWRPK